MIVGISGSLREASYNSALLRVAQDAEPGTITLASIGDFPLYNADLESVEVPGPVCRVKRQLMEADGLLLASPEYNNSVPGVLKNAIDWLSRPSLGVKNVFRGKPVAVFGATPGGFGTVLAQSAWLPVFRTLGAELWTGDRLLVSHANHAFDEAGLLTDERTRERLRKFVRGFVRFAEVGKSDARA
jgi:NAD(P)H-dependent FMN reductase